MDFKEARLKARYVPVCLSSLIILSLSFIAWLMLPSTVEASPSVFVGASAPGNNALTDPTQTTGIAVSGNTIYVAVKGIWCASKYNSAEVLLKSTDGGLTWQERFLPGTVSSADYVAVAPDDGNFVAVVDKTSLSVVISTNGGFTWSGLAQPPVTAINDIAISPLASGVRYIVVAGVAGGAGAVHYYNYGAVAPFWQNPLSATWANLPPPQDAFWAVKFSSNFLADYCMLVVSAKSTQGVQLHVASFNILGWNQVVDAAFPRTITAAGGVTINGLDIALDPNFYMGDTASQISFIGASVTNNVGAEIGGVYRIFSYSTTQILTGVVIDSVAWDGTNLFAGTSNNNNVYRSTNALATVSFTFSTISGSNAPAGEKNALVAISGPNVIAATSGSGSGISRSTDGGVTFQTVLPYLFNGPVLVSPANNATGISQNPAFSWQAVPYATLYRFELATDAYFTNIVYTIDSSTTAAEVPKLTSAMTYYWRVKCLLPVEGLWSATYAFTVAQKTTVPPPVTSPVTTTTTTTSHPLPGSNGFPVAPVAGGVAGGVAAVGAGALAVKLLRKPNGGGPSGQGRGTEREIAKKFQEAGVEIKVVNRMGRPEVKTAKTIRMENLFSISVTMGTARHIVKAAGRPGTRHGKED